LATDAGGDLAVLEFAQVAVRDRVAALCALVRGRNVEAGAAARAARSAVVRRALIALLGDGRARCARAGGSLQIVAIRAAGADQRLVISLRALLAAGRGRGAGNALRLGVGVGAWGNSPVVSALVAKGRAAVFGVAELAVGIDICAGLAALGSRVSVVALRAACAVGLVVGIDIAVDAVGINKRARIVGACFRVEVGARSRVELAAAVAVALAVATVILVWILARDALYHTANSLALVAAQPKRSAGYTFSFKEYFLYLPIAFQSCRITVEAFYYAILAVAARLASGEKIAADIALGRWSGDRRRHGQWRYGEGSSRARACGVFY